MLQGKVAFSDEKYAKDSERLQPFKTRMLDLVRANGSGRILDIGCGTGVVSRSLRDAGWEVYGLDISSEGIKKYCRSGFCGLVSNAEHSLPFKDRTFDAVWISEVIEHLVDYRNLIEEIGRVLKVSGRLYITAPNSVFYLYRLLYLLGKCPTELQHPYHVRFFSHRHLAGALREKGFEIEQSLGQNIYGFVPGSLVRAAERVSRSLTQSLLACLGFKRVEGLIHGDKFLLYRFSSFLPSLFSNAVMIVAAKAAYGCPSPGSPIQPGTKGLSS